MTRGNFAGQAVRVFAAFLSCIFLVTRPAVAAPSGAARTTAEGTAFRMVTADGAVLRSPDLTGTVLALTWRGEAIRLRIDAVARDPERPDVWLHVFSIEQPDGRWTSFCAAAADGTRAGFPVPGHATPNGGLETAADGGFELVCTAGARGKCIRFGYDTWHGPEALRRYNACVHMVRADYAGNGGSTTRDGTIIEIDDDWRGDVRRGDFLFEAGWDDLGAVCVRHARISRNIALAALETAAPRLRGRTGTICTPAFARAHGALIYNGSRP